VKLRLKQKLKIRKFCLEPLYHALQINVMLHHVSCGLYVKLPDQESCTASGSSTGKKWRPSFEYFDLLLMARRGFYLR
jgi:hypothetical protein